ncbi:MAG: hypothetical protein MJ135_01860 [Oscillospiraceae bacterium]|nr:hypothetical protein [Oscillospiraceae bacterium]
MKNEFYVNKVRAIVCAIGSVATLVPCITCLWYGELFGTAVLAIGFLWFFVQVLFSGAKVKVDEKGVTKSLLGKELMHQSWSEIGEVGAVGLKVFQKDVREVRPGTIYMYFSPEKLNNQKRFELALKFPPKNMIYMRYDKERDKVVQSIWPDRIIGYNTGSSGLWVEEDE